MLRPFEDLGVSDFGRKLRELRLKAKLSQYALAKRTGLARQTITYLEDQQNDPSWKTVQLVAKALGVPFEAFAEDHLELPIQPAKPAAEQPAKPASKRSKK